MPDRDDPSTPPQEADVFSRACASRDVLHDVTGRWGTLVMVALMRAEQPMRFAELRRRIDGVSDRMLSQTLSTLEGAGAVERSVLSTIPPHVEYALTPLGRRLARPLADLVDVVQTELPHVLVARDAHAEGARAS